MEPLRDPFGTMEMSKKDKPEIGYVDYHFDPDAHRKNTYAYKQKMAREADRLEEQREIYARYVRWFFAFTGAGFLLVVIGMATPGWCSYLEIQRLQTVELDTLLRTIDWTMTIEGVKIFQQYCDELGEAPCVPDKVGYESFVKPELWSEVKGKRNGGSYEGVAALAASASSNVINSVIFNVMVALGSACVQIYGLYYKANRKVCIFTLFMMNFGVVIGMTFTILFVRDTEPLRILLRDDNYLSPDIEPFLETDYSFMLTVVGIAILALAAVPYYYTIPVDDGKVEGSDLKAERIQEVNRRVKQYMEDRTNTTHAEEFYTDTPDPKRKLVPVRSNPEGRPHPTPPKENSPFVKSNDFPMIQPGNRLERLVMPGEQHTGRSPRDRSVSPLQSLSPGAASPGSPGTPSSPTLAGPPGLPPQLPGVPEEVPTMGGFPLPDMNDKEAVNLARQQNPKFDLMIAAKKRRELQNRIRAEEAEKNKTVARPGSEAALIEAAVAAQEKRKMDGIEEPPPPSRPVTRERHITRAPNARDVQFANNVAVGVMTRGDRAGLLNNYNFIPDEPVKKTTERKW